MVDHVVIHTSDSLQVWTGNVGVERMTGRLLGGTVIVIVITITIGRMGRMQG